jgi:3-isopropylmalate/(R)-2-methylmalate dehydratase small subunit
MSSKLRGKVWRFEGIMDVDWEICPVEHMEAFRENPNKTYEQRLAELGIYCMTTIDPDFPKKVRPGDIIVGDNGFGYGHDHDHACMSIKGAGIAAVVCESSNSNFMRNSIHHGLAVVEIKGIMNGVRTSDELEVDLEKGRATNLSTGKSFSFVPYPDFLLEIINAGGLYKQLTRQVESGDYK